MFNSKRFFRETAETASFAVREYFRPLVVVFRFLKSPFASSGVAEATPDEQAGLEEARALDTEKKSSR